ncbi:uncharacterized protein N7496_000457 [Penicillium cataractarum]|uniref:3'-5' exonuclease domain-containing protein n=1 Tax=Penicillium cataractarum TaxID=2100454 RepID=A0A9X0B5Y3_9EURO|nr:uncharacterized protein N7496_000457 [Penicillium cataractarum]KAJ5389389.1 hypothetical protein N7496_000457 [Penicillium cataractarum]
MSATKPGTFNICTRAVSKDASVTRVSTISPLEESLQEMSLDGGKTVNFIDTEEGLIQLIERMENIPTNPPSLYVDLEGVDLSRRGTISILQVFIYPLGEIYLVDIYTLQTKAFTVCSSKRGQTLLAILESPNIPKVFFDVRNDSDALFSHFGVELAGVIDLQLMELATRYFSKRCVNGLAKCIERDAPINGEQRRIWREFKEKGRQLFAPELGGSFEIFNVRPLPDSILKYCAQDVHILPLLWVHYDSKMSLDWRKKVAAEAIKRVKESQSPNYIGTGRHMALEPSGWW